MNWKGKSFDKVNAEDTAKREIMLKNSKGCIEHIEVIQECDLHAQSDYKALKQLAEVTWPEFKRLCAR